MRAVRGFRGRPQATQLAPTGPIRGRYGHALVADR
jgi:hypothetical protein